MPIALKVGSYPVITFPPAKNSMGNWTIEKDQDNIKALFHDADDILRGYALTGSFLEERQRCLQSIGKKAHESIS
jgi:rubredoxin-NAD+ reductase